MAVWHACMHLLAATVRLGQVMQGSEAPHWQAGPPACPDSQSLSSPAAQTQPCRHVPCLTACVSRHPAPNSSRPCACKGELHRPSRQPAQQARLTRMCESRSTRPISAGLVGWLRSTSWLAGFTSKWCLQGRREGRQGGAQSEPWSRGRRGHCSLPACRLAGGQHRRAERQRKTAEQPLCTHSLGGGIQLRARWQGVRGGTDAGARLPRQVAAGCAAEGRRRQSGGRRAAW